MKRGSAIGAALACVGLLTAQPAAAQYTQRSSTTFVIRGAGIPQGEKQVLASEPLLRQDVTSTRAARLVDSAPAPKILLGKSAVTPPDTLMFGVQAPNGWIYCAISQIKALGMFDGELFACYQDNDADGRFDVSRPSGAPFGGIPLLVFQPGPPEVLPTPIAYKTIPYQEGPKVDMTLNWASAGPRQKKGEPFKAPEAVNIFPQLVSGNTKMTIGRNQRVKIPADGSGAKVRYHGAELTLLGFTPEGALRYRVEKTMPEQVSPMSMTITTTTYYYVY